jgi:AcrR family transcriptional regulator
MAVPGSPDRESDPREMTPDPLNRGYATGRATREAIMQTAERLFAERGLEGVSLREIATASGQRNNNAAQYHFGDRDGLIKAIYAYRAYELNEHRLAAIAGLGARGSLGDPFSLLRALLEPHARHIGDPEWHFLGFLDQLRVARGHFGYPELERPDYMAGFDILAGHLRSCFSQLTEDVFERRFNLVFGWAIQALANYERTINGPGPFAMTVAQAVDEIVVMLIGALGSTGQVAEPRLLHSLPAEQPRLKRGS